MLSKIIRELHIIQFTALQNCDINDYQRRKYMERNISIRPSKDIRTNYAKISELTRQNPVAITVNGREDTVLLSHEDFSRQITLIEDLQARLELYKHLADSADDIKLGRIQSADSVFDEIEDEIRNYGL